MQDTLSNQIDCEGLWQIIAEPPKDSPYYKGQIVEITDIIIQGHDYWSNEFDDWCCEPIARLEPSDVSFHWTKLSNLRKIYEI